MSLLALALAGEIRSADAEAKRLASAGLLPDALRAAIHRAEDCLADLERAERLLDSERAAAERSRDALTSALALAELAAGTAEREADLARHQAAAKRQKGGRR